MPPFGPLVDAAWLSDHIDEVVVADVRWYLDGRSGRAAYEAGHLPGAVFVDLDTVLAARAGHGPGRHPLPDLDVFAAAMGALGIGDDTGVVAYDDASGSVAARLWWMLRATGHEVAVLDGGIQAWTGPIESGPGRAPAPRAFTTAARSWPVLDADAVAAFEGVVLDARAPERYRGEVEPIDSRAGHIPRARNAPWSANIDPATGGLRSPDELAEHFRSLGAGDGRALAVYCGSGVTACFDLLALEVAGIDNGQLYEGSWSDWSSDPRRPVETS